VIQFFFEDEEEFIFPSKQFSDWLIKCISEHSFICGDISVILCSDNYLLDINRQYLDHDYYTDIITFNYNESEVISGDLFISVPRIKENADEFNISFSKEFKRVLIHGILHLVGYNDKTDEEQKVMREKEDYYLNIIGDVE